MKKTKKVSKRKASIKKACPAAGKMTKGGLTHGTLPKNIPSVGPSGALPSLPSIFLLT